MISQLVRAQICDSFEVFVDDLVLNYVCIPSSVSQGSSSVTGNTAVDNIVGVNSVEIMMLVRDGVLGAPRRLQERTHVLLLVFNHGSGRVVRIRIHRRSPCQR